MIRRYFALLGMIAVMFVGLILLIESADAATQAMLLREGGVVDLVSVLGLFGCLVLMFFKGGARHLKQCWYMYVMVGTLACRELDFHSRFTEKAVTSMRFYRSAEIPFLQKVVVLAIVILLLNALYELWVRETPRFMRALRQRDLFSISSISLLTALVMCVLMDGFRRHLAFVGFEVSASLVAFVGRIEEVMEMWIPVLTAMSIVEWFRFVRLEWAQREAILSFPSKTGPAQSQSRAA